jgi:hypothetical protein
MIKCYRFSSSGYYSVLKITLLAAVFLVINEGRPMYYKLIIIENC